ncbi:MAG: sugar phosphate isomerase/epimerase [Phycisphaerales bacterium]
MNRAHLTRRDFALSAFAAAAFPALARPQTQDVMFRISLAQWSLHRTLFAGDLDPLDFAPAARDRYAIDAVELVNTFIVDKARDTTYLDHMKRRADDAGVSILLIMCDGIGAIGDPDPVKRGQAVDGHVRWLEAAARLGCHAIRVNAQSNGTWDEQQQRAADGLHRLATLAVGYELDVIVENHGGLSSNGAWLAGVIRRVDLDNCGTLPDFGNFCTDWSRSSDPDAWYDRYKGVEELMPYAKAVSAKSHAFDAEGNETRTDYLRMMRIVTAAGYRGYVGIEYEGERVSEHEGILRTKALLERVRDQL